MTYENLENGFDPIPTETELGGTMLDYSKSLGSTLPNGFTIVALSQSKAHVWIVLGVLAGDKGFPARYATWECSRPGDGSDTRWGHYSNSIHDAVSDYQSRVGYSEREELDHAV